MKISIERLNCKELRLYKDSNRKTIFHVVKYEFNYNSELFDKTILDKITLRGEQLADSVNDKAANDSSKNRSKDRKRSNAIAGLLAEYCWKNYLNSVTFSNLVEETKFENAATQIDLKTIGTEKTIEVRSSFPRNGIEFAICSAKYEFDILGPYSNGYKPDEPQKDFYLRTLYHVASPVSFLDAYKNDHFVAYLTGGATWAMMTDDDIAIEKDLIPEDDFGETEISSLYRVVPFSRALDCREIYLRIKEKQE